LKWFKYPVSQIYDARNAHRNQYGHDPNCDFMAVPVLSLAHLLFFYRKNDTNVEIFLENILFPLTS